MEIPLKKDIVVFVDMKTGVVYKNDDKVGLTGENANSSIHILLKNLETKGLLKTTIGRIEIKRYNPDIKEFESYLIDTQPIYATDDEIIGYSIPILSSLLKYEGIVYFQLMINYHELVYKSDVFYLNVGESINAEVNIPDEYPSWIERASVALAEIENIDISSERIEKGVKISITNKLGVTTTNIVHDGEKGEQGERGLMGFKGDPGRDGYVQYEAGTNVTIDNNIINADINTLFYKNINLPGKFDNITDEKFLARLEKEINEALDTGVHPQALIILDYGYYDYNEQLYTFCVCNERIRTNTTTYHFYGEQWLSKYTENDGGSNLLVRGIQVTGSWNNNIFKLTKCTGFYGTSKKVITTAGFDNALTNITGYDATKTQVLKNVNGTLSWVTEGGQ